jgi:dihydroorotase
MAYDYFLDIKKAAPNFEPLMTIYFNEYLNNDVLDSIQRSECVYGIKLYPSGVTTNSEKGIKSIDDCFPIFENMESKNIPLLLHGEVNDPSIDIFDREKVFIDEKLDFICKELPDLKITFEHITTKEATKYVKEGNKNLVASITPHHLALNRNALFVGGIRPHNYCLPILKRETHRKVLLKAAISGNPKFFLGTDTAPHLTQDKESDCGCAGVFNATYCLSILAQLFDNENSLNNLEKFISRNGANHYNLKTNNEKVLIVKSNETLSFREYLHIGNQKIKIFKPDFPVFWTISD